jgi:hypothetical protein
MARQQGTCTGEAANVAVARNHAPNVGPQGPVVNWRGEKRRWR